MRNTSLAWMPAAVLMLAAGCAGAQDLKIGYVDTARIETESVPAVRALEAMKREFEPREKQILELQRQIKVDRDRYDTGKATIPPAELRTLGNSIASRMRESDQLVYGLTTDIEQRKRENAVKLIQEANLVIKAIAEQGKYDLIVQQAIFARPAIDITDQVLKEMARRAGN